jgi:eukaryotic translation initiation factor 2C
MDESTIGNILLKVNAKLNGVNHILSPNVKPPIIRCNVMAIGADVTHPSPDQMTIPSVVGVASSTDNELSRYTFTYRLQGPRDEMIRDLENIIEKSYRDYRSCNGGALPERVFYFRDGVSEGQFQEILTIELNAMKKAAQNVAKAFQVDWNPKITFVCVQKRHHTRFFPIKGTPTYDKNQNLPPGTVVDKEITKPMEYQFFLISHAAVQGVAKPTKYCILADDGDCHPDQLQALTYYLCHMFTRCNRSVSYPAPTYYAHLAAFRGRMYIKNQRLNLNNLEQEYRTRVIRTDVSEGHPMFFV